ncbi:HAMP domain-containing sensor histidine kinase [Sulfurovum sp.]|uniref:sensor histidine kinase n=1 Tax=Sulfurovum sp. TaxID=1969726 RepID=UPI002867CA72|nr:HAMP domain-containing sensor histidine kinase [Sulfurovum sp.]
MRKELLFATAIFLVTILTLLAATHRFLESWELNEFTFFIAGALVLLAILGWGYVLFTLIFAPKKQMEDTLTTLTNDIIHELNIPLATIKANSAMLKKNMEDEKSLKRIQRIEDAGERLKKLYDELVYSIHKEMHTIEKEKFDLARLVEERVSVFQEQKRNTFHLTLEPYEIEADKIGFEQMFDNILSNAMKYSAKEKPVTVTLGQHSLSVKDEGVGMSPTALLRVHERYYQADEKKDGEGIGLALVKTYCDEEGIDIHIKSAKGEGTCVSLNVSKIHV